MEIDGEEWLSTRPFRSTSRCIRGTTADPAGNITMEREALVLDALAARDGGAQLPTAWSSPRSSASPRRGSLDPRQVVVPGVLVDCVVLAPPEHHLQTYGTAYNAAFAAEIRVPPDKLAAACRSTSES